MKTLHTRFVLGALAIAFSLASVNSFGATIPYTDKMGTSVMFTNISETDIDPGDDGVARFGDPTASGDSLDFNPFDFDASHSNGVGAPDMTDVQLNFQVMAKPNRGFTQIIFTEQGDTTLSRGFGTGLDALTTVTAKFFVEILEVDGAPVPGGPINLNQNMAFNPSSGDYQLSVDAPSALSFASIWNGTVTFNLGSELLARNILYTRGVTKANVVLDNTLTAASTANANALIVKKDADGVVITVVPDDQEIPEPATVALLGLGLAAFAVARKK